MVPLKNCSREHCQLICKSMRTWRRMLSAKVDSTGGKSILHKLQKGACFDHCCAILSFTFYSQALQTTISEFSCTESGRLCNLWLEASDPAFGSGDCRAMLWHRLCGGMVSQINLGIAKGWSEGQNVGICAEIILECFHHRSPSPLMKS